METQNKLRALEQKKIQQQAQIKQREKQKESRKKSNLIHAEIDHINKVNNYMQAQDELEWQLKQKQEDKRKGIENLKKEKESYYNSKVSYAKQVIQYAQ